MKNAEKIENYIKECFEENSLDYDKYFSVFQDGNIIKMSLVEENGKINRDAVAYASEILGISEDDIYAMNNDAIFKWNMKYPYIWNIRGFEHACNRAYYGPGYDEFRLYEALFDEKMEGPYPPKYDYKNVRNRLVAILKEYDEVRPGTYHNGAEIKSLRINTENFCHFEDIKKMAESYIFMAETLIELFTKALTVNLCEDEIKEYNFLVSVFGFKDRCFPGAYLYYSNLINCRIIYQSVTRENIYDYTTLERLSSYLPWRSAEFVSDSKLVKKYLTTFPQAKQLMREFAINVSRFECQFVWSDDKSAINPSQDNFDDNLTSEDLSFVIPTCVYVPKLPLELNGDHKTAQQLLGYCRPVKLGGVDIQCPKTYSAEESAARIIKLFGKIKENNFFERLYADLKSSEKSSGEYGGNEL